ncbi:MAG: hypothetical protein SNG97_02505 [Rikenellaceae bacterium]
MLLLLFVAPGANVALGAELYELSYDDATSYYTAPIMLRRRAFEWWISNEVLSSSNYAHDDCDTPYKERDRAQRVRLFASTTRYIAGAAASYFRDIEVGDATSLAPQKSWMIDLSADIRGGNDLTIDGVGRQDMKVDFAAQRRYRDTELAIVVALPSYRRNLQSSSTAEPFALLNNNLYNPAWGVDNGEVRNSRISKYAVPELSVDYTTPLRQGGATTLQLQLHTKMGRRSITRLGWYDGETPTPDYYRYLPSYLDSASQYDEVAALWSANDIETTQISWSRLRQQNGYARDGVANYYVEDQVERMVVIDAAALFTTRLKEGAEGSLDVTYGIEASFANSRLFKKMEDMLGGSYYIDLDSYIGDESRTGTTLANDLQNPNRRVTTGDRFGYDFSRNRYAIRGLLAIQYERGATEVSLKGAFGDQTMWRTGHYEKERFQGEKSLGRSQRISMSDSRLEFSASHEIGEKNRIYASGALLLLPIESRDLFLQEQNANTTIDDPTPQQIANLDLGYSARLKKITFSAVAFATSIRNKTQTWQVYDDILNTYCDAVISDIAMNNFGVELAARYLISKKLSLDMTLAAGSYRYAGAPTVTLYDDADMSYIMTTQASAIDRCVVGNAPQIYLTSTLTWNIAYQFNLHLKTAYAAGRYIEPSIYRRTDRVIAYSDISPEMVQEITLQENLGAIFDLSISLYKGFTIAGRKIALNAILANILGNKSQINYAREANRTFATSIQQSTYTYAVGRNISLSASYIF